MTDLDKKIEKAISIYRTFEPKDEPYYVCYSGGKDSDVIRILADLSGVNYELHNNHTTVDAPETVYYIREVMSRYGERERVIDPIDGHTIYRYGTQGFIHLPLETMWSLVAKKGLPIRTRRYCCEELKEKGGKGRVCVTGVRWAESVNRKKNQGLVTIFKPGKKETEQLEKASVPFALTPKGGVVLNTDNADSRRGVEMCYRTRKTLINPIIDWTDDDVWDFLRMNGCESNPLYKEGFTRIGCIACPIGTGKGQKRDFAKWPSYRNCYLSAVEKYWEVLEERCRTKTGYREKMNEWGWTSPEAIMRWWVGDDPHQITLEDYFGDLEDY